MPDRICLRKAAAADADRVLLWRNDPLTRKNSFRGSTISPVEHDRWYRQVLCDPGKLLLIGVDHRGEGIGVVRFDLHEKQAAEINVNVAPEKRGCGLGTELIEKAVTYIMDHHAVDQIVARVKEGNNASIRAFQKAGFRLKANKDGVVCMEARAGDRIMADATLPANDHPEVEERGKA